MNKLNIKQSLTGLMLLSALALNINVAQATVYHYENNNLGGSIMNDYSVSWNTNTEDLDIVSSWDIGAGVDRIAFLLSDGASPHVTGNYNTGEQFLWHDINLNTGILTVTNYFGPRITLDTFDVSADITASSINLSLDHSYLNSLTAMDINVVTGRNHSAYSGAGFSDDIGIWYYMYSGKSRVETLDVHHGNTTSVPEPNVLFLFAIGLLAFGGTRSALKRNR